MKTKTNSQLFYNLRNDNKFFTFEGYDFKIIDNCLEIIYSFNLADKVNFNPKLRFLPSKHINYNSFNKHSLNNFVFHMGMVELISYWKAACPKKVIIKPSYLSSEQIEFWKKLYFHGLGEFFYLNGISVEENSFMYITTHGKKLNPVAKELSNNKVIVPVGGGKDSIVTLELLKEKGMGVIPFFVNPREASWRTIEVAGFTKNDCIVVERTIDKKLIDLNNKGYLNGHTPFSAMVAFTSATVSFLTGISNVALSNESSANESTVPGSMINHQYSKSFEFEKDFHEYSKKFLLQDMHYFSFLRPINELQIAKLFSKFNQHFATFRSCNVGSKKDVWWGKCPKCLFTYILLGPFVDEKILIEIFGANMLKDNSLDSIFRELTGIAEVKPFECVGTPEEVIAAISAGVGFDNIVYNSARKLKESDSFGKLLTGYNSENLLPHNFDNILKDALNG